MDTTAETWFSFASQDHAPHRSGSLSHLLGEHGLEQDVFDEERLAQEADTGFLELLHKDVHREMLLSRRSP